MPGRGQRVRYKQRERIGPVLSPCAAASLQAVATKPAIFGLPCVESIKNGHGGPEERWRTNFCAILSTYRCARGGAHNAPGTAMTTVADTNSERRGLRPA